MKRNSFCFSILVLSVLLNAFGAQAAVITWGAATAVGTGAGNSTDVLVTGHVIEAFNAQASDSTLVNPTVNGVTFVGTSALLSGGFGAKGADLSTETHGGDAAYDTLLSDADNGGGGNLFTIQIGGGLTAGSEYLVQVWFVDDRAAFDTRVMQFGDGSGNTVLVNDQFVIGTFTASGSSQDLSLDAQSFGNAHITAYQVRGVGPPAAPDVPAGLDASAGSSAEIILNWNDNTQYGFSNFILRRSLNQGGPYTDVPGATPSVSTYTDTNLVNGTPYYYVVVAKNTADEISAPSAEASATPKLFVPPLPDVPTGLVVTAGNLQVNLDWDDNIQAGFTNFIVKRALTSGGPYTHIAGATPVTSSYTDTGLTNGTTYYYVVSALNSLAVESDNSIEASATPRPPPPPSVTLPNRPNIIFAMADDMGWGDWGLGGRSPSEWATPNLDSMANSGIRFNRFYAQSPVCSPTRFSVLTGRHPDRNGITTANQGRLEEYENTIYERLKEAGYATGHFGKWHLGTLTTARYDANRGRVGNTADYSPPWLHGVENCFVTESKVPTFNPMRRPGGLDLPTSYSDSRFYGTYYWQPPAIGQALVEGTPPDITDNLEGDDSRVLMDRAIPFIQNAVQEGKPFVTCLWFHTPHKPLVIEDTGVENNYVTGYSDAMEGLDLQMGRLRTELQNLGVWSNTVIWFCSDNGPEDGSAGSAGIYRARKRSLYEGGVRVPGFVVWPEVITTPRTTDFPMVTTDYYPTMMDILDYPDQGDELPLDGISVKDLIFSNMTVRTKPIGFRYQPTSDWSWVTHQYKLITTDNGNTYQLYDLLADGGESANVAAAYPEIVAQMAADMNAWINSIDMDSDHDRLPDDWETIKLGNLLSSGSDDNDLDGADNLTEYTFGSDPDDILSTPQFGIQVDPSQYTLEYFRPSENSLGVNYTIVTSSNLNTWATATNSAETTVTDQEGGIESVQVRFEEDEEKAFFQVHGETIN